MTWKKHWVSSQYSTFEHRSVFFLDTTLRNCVRYKPCLLGNRFYGMMLENNEEKRGLGTN